MLALPATLTRRPARAVSVQKLVSLCHIVFVCVYIFVRVASHWIHVKRIKYAYLQPIMALIPYVMPNKLPKIIDSETSY